jgi:hypothetical protein
MIKKILLSLLLTGVCLAEMPSSPYPYFVYPPTPVCDGTLNGPCLRRAIQGFHSEINSIMTNADNRFNEITQTFNDAYIAAANVRDNCQRSASTPQQHSQCSAVFEQTWNSISNTYRTDTANLWDNTRAKVAQARQNCLDSIAACCNN